MYTDIQCNGNGNGIYCITFNRPQVLNAVSNTMTIEMVDALTKLRENDDCRVLILTGTDRAFTVGADTDAAVQLKDEDYNAYLARFSQMLQLLTNFPAPVIAMVNGLAFGGGAEVACVCDMRIGSTKSKFRFPGASYGLVVSASSLSTIVSLPKAKELLFISGIVDAEEAYRIGLLNQLVAPEELESYTYQYAEKIVNNPKIPVQKIKEVFNQMAGKSQVERREVSNTANDFLRTNTKQRETFANFTDKRRTARDW
jgi:enoyl-CoA hydratase